MNSRFALLSLPALVLAACLAGCITGSIDPPDGYIETDATGQYAERYISADQNVLASRVEDNPKGGTLDFWAKAVRHEMVDVAGYTLKEECEIAAGRLTGRLFDFRTCIDQQEHVYLLALFVTSRQITLVEAGGQCKLIQADREKLIKAIRSLR